MMKLCKTCGLDKPYDPTKNRGTKANGFQGMECYPCYKERSRVGNNTLREDPKFRIAYNEHNAAWYREHPEVTTAKSAVYRAGKDNRIVGWTDHEVISIIYQVAQYSGKTVDHIIPLHGKLVSGLHVHQNLQLLSKSENSRKRNVYHVS